MSEANAEIPNGTPSPEREQIPRRLSPPEQARLLIESAQDGHDGIITQENFPDIPEDLLKEHRGAAQFIHADRLDSIADNRVGDKEPKLKARLKKKAEELRKAARENLLDSVSDIELDDETDDKDTRSGPYL